MRVRRRIVRGEAVTRFSTWPARGLGDQDGQRPRATGLACDALQRPGEALHGGRYDRDQSKFWLVHGVGRRVLDALPHER